MRTARSMQTFVSTSIIALSFTASSASLYDSALVHYEFESLGAGGEVADSSPNNVDLIASGGTASLINGITGNAIRLPDGVVLTTTGTGSDDSILNVTRDTSFSLAAWIKLENATDRFFLASKVLREDPNDSDTGLELQGWSFTVDAGGKLAAIWRYDHTPTSGTSADARIIVNSDTTITDTAWHHVALTFSYDEADATRGMRIYLDGTLQPMTASSTGLAGIADYDLSHDSPFNFSGRYDSQLNEGGAVDDFAVWNSVLSPSDIAALAPEPATFSLLLGSLLYVGRASVRRKSN